MTPETNSPPFLPSLRECLALMAQNTLSPPIATDGLMLPFRTDPQFIDRLNQAEEILTQNGVTTVTLESLILNWDKKIRLEKEWLNTKDSKQEIQRINAILRFLAATDNYSDELKQALDIELSSLSIKERSGGVVDSLDDAVIPSNAKEGQIVGYLRGCSCGRFHPIVVKNGKPDMDTGWY